MSTEEFQTTIDSLREGDVVRFRHKMWPKNTYQEGPVFGRNHQCGSIILNGPDGWAKHLAEFEIAKRAPRFYVNADRTPVVGDVATTVDHQYRPGVGPWFYTERGWVSQRGTPIGDPKRGMPKGRSVLLYDAVTRKPLPEWVDPADGDR